MCFQLHPYRRRNVSSIEICVFSIVDSDNRCLRFGFFLRGRLKTQNRNKKEKLRKYIFFPYSAYRIKGGHYARIIPIFATTNKRFVRSPASRIKNNINAFNNPIDRTFALNVSREFNLLNSFGLCLSCSFYLFR